VTVPAHVTIADFAKACSYSPKMARSILRRAGLLERVDGVWGVSSERLRVALPDAFDDVQAFFEGKAETER